MTSHSKDRRSKPTIPFVYYHEKWRLSNQEPIWKLRKEGKCITIDEYKPELGDQNLYFCPSCGYPCHRSPKFSSIDRSGRPAFFKHKPSKNPIPCPLRLEKGAGRRYLTEKEKEEAVEQGCLAIVSEWSDRPGDENFIDRKSSSYQGTVEDIVGPLANRPIFRHTGAKKEVPRRISSLQYIASHIDQFLGQDIQLPDFLTPEPFLDIFIHASKIENSVRQLSGLYWGRIERVDYIEDYICINFGYDTHCIILGIKRKNAIDRHWKVSNLKGKYLVVAGKLEESSRLQAIENSQSSPRPCWRVLASKWGAFGVISEDLVHLLPLPTNFNWVEPPELEKLKKVVKKIDSISPSLLKNQSKPKNYTLQKESQISKDNYSRSEADKARKELQQPIQINQSNPKLQVQELNQLSNIENESESQANPDEKSMEPLIITASETHESGFYSLDSQSIPSENEPINLLFSQQQTNLKRSEPVEQQNRQSTNKRSFRFRYPIWLDNLINFRFSSLKNWMNRMWQRLRGRS